MSASRSVSLRWKIALAMAAITSLATVIVGAASYRATRDRLLAEVDRSLVEIEGPIFVRWTLPDDRLPERGPLAGFDVQTILLDGRVGQTTFPVPLPVSDADRYLVGRVGTNRFATVDTGAGEYRVRTIGMRSGALQLGRPLAETERVLAGLRSRVLLLVALVAVGAMSAGWWIASRVTASLRRLTGAAEQVEATGRLDIAIGGTAHPGDDEVGRLSIAFDRMLAALARSKAEQRRLVQDAGHELRTPLTSLRTNLDTLRRYPELPVADRDAIVADLDAETTELSDLVEEIIAVASGETADEPPVEFDLRDLAADVAARFERRTGRPVVVTGNASPARAARTGVQRAVGCLIDNACKFDTSGGPIEVAVGPGSVSVSDRGPGIPPGELELVFERFRRGDDARAAPGSGLGLAIVREVARRHGGDAFATARPGGGATVGFRLGCPPE